MLTPLNPGPLAAGRTTPAAPDLMPFSIGDRIFLYEANTLEVYRSTPDLAAAVMAAPAEVLGLRPAPSPGPHRRSAARAAWPSCSYLVLNLTRSCNLACTYCFVRAQSAEASTDAIMSADLAKGTIDALFPADPAAPSAPRIGFFGGEPLVAWGLVREVVTWIEERQCRLGQVLPHFSMTTNATLLGDEQAAFFGEAGRRDRFSFIVSLDGDRARHNALRPFRSTELAPQAPASWDATAAGLKRLAAFGFRPTLRSTFTADGLDLVGELSVLNEICDEGLAGHVSIEPVSLTEGCAFGTQAITPQRMRELEPEYLRAADWFCARARAGKRARFHHLGKMLERLIGKRPSVSECGAGRGYLALCPEGELHACHRAKSAVGRMERRPDAEGWAPVWSPARDAWADNCLEARRACPTCPLRWLCGGGCRQDSLDDTGDVRLPDPLGCALTMIRFRMAVRVLDQIGPECAAAALGLRRGHRCPAR